MSHRQARPLAALILCAIACSTIAITVGMLASLSYFEQFPSIGGLTLQHLRPLHTTFATAWIYLAGVAVVYFYLISQVSKPSRAFRARLKLQIALWVLAGIGILVSVCGGVFSGREYLGAHWIWSLLIYLGWILFAWNFFSVVGFGLRGKPVFVYMWYTAILLFLWSFAEGHAWLLTSVSEQPLRDIAIQWKSYGPLVGTFNLIVYGSLGYIACCRSGDAHSACSRTAYCLLFVGVVNSFTNFGHHTYHLPQSHLVKWISCIVSWAETIVVAKYMIEVFKLFRHRRGASATPGVGFILGATTVWSCVLVGIALVISVPPLNALIHGTHFVMAHAMGSMLGIDSMALWACLLFVIGRMRPPTCRLGHLRSVVPVFAVVNLGVFLLVALLTVKGAITGYLRYMGPAAPAPPQFLTMFPIMFFMFGSLLALPILHINMLWARSVWPFLRQPADH